MEKTGQRGSGTRIKTGNHMVGLASASLGQIKPQHANLETKLFVVDECKRTVVLLDDWLQLVIQTVIGSSHVTLKKNLCQGVSLHNACPAT